MKYRLILSQYDAVNGEDLRRLVLSGTGLLPYSLEILQAARKSAFELYEETASQEAGFRQIYTQWQAFRSEICGWNQANELSLIEFVA